MNERNPNWVGYLRAPKENVSRKSLEDLFVAATCMTDDQGLLLDLKLEDVLQDWVIAKLKENT